MAGWRNDVVGVFVWFFFSSKACSETCYSSSTTESVVVLIRSLILQILLPVLPYIPFFPLFCEINTTQKKKRRSSSCYKELLKRNLLQSADTGDSKNVLVTTITSVGRPPYKPCVCCYYRNNNYFH